MSDTQQSRATLSRNCQFTVGKLLPIEETQTTTYVYSYIANCFNTLSEASSECKKA